MKPFFRLTILALLLGLCYYKASGQEIDGTKIKVVSEIIPLEGRSISDIHEEAFKWIGEAFNNPDQVIKTDTDNLLLVRYLNSFYVGMSGKLQFYHELKIDVKENKVRFQLWITKPQSLNYTATSFFYNDSGEIRRINKKGLHSLVSNGENLYLDFKSYMIDEDSDNDW